MPRRTTRQFQVDHDWLRELWLRDKGWFARLAFREQWRLHAYFEPSLDLGLEELQAHRARISKERPALPQQAGRALANLCRTFEYRMQYMQVRETVKPGKRTPRGKVMVKAVAKPHPGAKRLARALVAAAFEAADRELRREQPNRTGSK